MTTGHMIVLLYFVVFAIINFVIFMKLAKYWYMTAGVTKEDVARYMSEHISRRRYNYLIRWMRKRARDAKKFNMMLFFVPVGVGLITSYTLLSRYMLAIIVASLVSTVLVIAVVGLVEQKLESKRDSAKNEQKKDARTH